MEIDLRVGISFSELISSKLSELFNPYYEKGDTVSYGPWQFPTFWFCYERMQEIKDFESEVYWIPTVEILYDEQIIQLKYTNSKIESEVEAKQKLLAIKNEDYIKVIDRSEHNKIIKKPEPINTNDLIRMASTKYGFPSDKTKRIAERLYSKGYISYPRTQGRKYTSEDEVNDILIEYSK